MEYINGGDLSYCLKKYMKKHKKAFPEEIVQHLMKQILEALYYLHKQNIIHRDLKLDNIMVNFDSEQDKQNLNMMKSKIKIIDFGFSIKLTAEKNYLAFTAIGSPFNMDPLILNKYAKRKGINLGYDQKIDIWSIGTVCYELLIGKAVFDSKTLKDLIEKVEIGDFIVPKSVSKEIVSFLNVMLQYDPKMRQSAEELRNHPFLIKSPSDFTRMDTIRATKNPESKLKKNKTIWGIFNNEEKFLNIQGGQNNYLSNLSMAQFTEEEVNKKNIKIKKEQGRNRSECNYTNNQLSLNELKSNTNINFPNNNNNSVNLHKAFTRKDLPVYHFTGISFYGQNMHPTSQVSQSGLPDHPMMGFQSQQKQMMQNPNFGIGIPQNFGGFYNQRNLATQENLLKTRTFKGDSNQLFKGMK